MKKVILFIALFFITINISAQNFSYGKATPDEIDMKSYSKDTSASAVVLNEFGNAEITVMPNNTIRMIYEYHVKIKIFDHKGFSNGTVELHLNNNLDNELADEINNLSGITTYKDDKGILQVAELDPKNIYKEKNNKYRSTIKFAMPGLHDGCVIEYRYILISPFFDRFHSWEFQNYIPKIYTEYNARIPGFWNYKIALRGGLKLSKDETSVDHGCFSAFGARCDCLKLNYAMKDVPAFKTEDYMTSPRNFMAALNFDLSDYTDLTSGVKTKVTKEWKDVDYQLKNDDDFGSQLKKAGMVKDYVPDATLSITDTLKKAKAIYKWAQSWFKWNHYRGIYSQSIKKAITDHTGSIADINFTLIDALNAAGINAETVLLSTRDNGLINKLYPVIDEFNYLVAKVKIDNKNYFLDATDPLLPFGILPMDCLNDQGRVFSMDKPSYWINLDTKQRRTSTYALNLILHEDGKLTGTLNNYSQGYEAYLKRKEIKRFNSPDEYIEHLNVRFPGLKILKATILNTDSLDAPIKEEYEVEIGKEGPVHNKLALNPYFYDRLNVNPFRLSERTYPVDMGMPRDERILVNIQLPPKYVIEGKLQNQTLSLFDNDGLFTTHFENIDNSLHFSSLIQINRSTYQPGEYPGLKEFFNKIILAEKSDLVFRKEN